MDELLNNRMIYTAIYTIIFKTANGKETRYRMEETDESVFIRSNYGQ